MGFFDKIKQKAQEAVSQVQNNLGGQQPQQEVQALDDYPQGTTDEHVPQQAYGGPTFTWDDDVYPVPPGWDDVLGSAEAFFLRFEEIRDHLMRADEENLQELVDEDGVPLDAEEVLLITRYGFKNSRQWEGWRNYNTARFASQAGVDFATYSIQQAGIAREKIQGASAAAMSGPGGQLEPVEGVTLETWAKLQAAVASGGNLPQLLASAGLDQPRWDRVSAEWNARMSADTTCTIATVYGNAFVGGGQYGAQAVHAAQVGVGGDLGAEPIPFETFVEVQEAMNAAANRGQDASAVLAQFGLSPVDWGNVGMFWSKRIQQDGIRYAERYDQLSAHFRAKYGG